MENINIVGCYMQNGHGLFYRADAFLLDGSSRMHKRFLHSTTNALTAIRAASSGISPLRARHLRPKHAVMLPLPYRGAPLKGILGVARAFIVGRGRSVARTWMG